MINYLNFKNERSNQFKIKYFRHEGSKVTMIEYNYRRCCFMNTLKKGNKESKPIPPIIILKYRWRIKG